MSVQLLIWTFFRHYQFFSCKHDKHPTLRMGVMSKYISERRPNWVHCKLLFPLVQEKCKLSLCKTVSFFFCSFFSKLCPREDILTYISHFSSQGKDTKIPSAHISLAVHVTAHHICDFCLKKVQIHHVGFLFGVTPGGMSDIYLH